MLAGLTGCTPPPVEEPRREVKMLPAPAPPPPRPAPTRAPLRATWTFESGNDQCVASADAGSASVRVTIRRNAAAELLVSFATRSVPASPVPLRFSGPAGDWQVQARRSAARALGVTLGADNTALTHVLVLLSGGTFDVGSPERPIASVVIAPSDTRGQAWFDCARGMMF
jgi:hypothetical protein